MWNLIGLLVCKEPFCVLFIMPFLPDVYKPQVLYSILDIKVASIRLISPQIKVDR